MIYTVTLNPALDRTVTVPRMGVDTVNRITDMRSDPGGKGINVSKAIAGLGGSSTALALLGGSTGQMIADALGKMGLKTCLTFIPGETRTNLKVVDPLLHTNTDINEPGPRVSGEVLEGMLAELTAMLVPGDIAVLSGSLPQGAPADTWMRWVSACRASGAKVFLDADGDLLAQGLEGVPYLVKPNTDELSRLMGRPLESEADLTGAARALLTRGVEKVVVSMGSRGALYVTRGEVLRAEGLEVSVGSTVGAGDSMVAALALAEERGLPAREALCFATAAGAASVMRSGSQAPEYETVRSLLERVVCRSVPAEGSI